VIDDNPDLTDPGNDDFTLTAVSPAIDEGFYETPVDFYFGSAPDIGAHEYDPGGQTITVVLWRSNGTGAGDDGDFMMKATTGAVTRTATLSDYSAL
jgi:hypothetical protein